MFGEEPIYGRSEMMIDDANRIILPSYTKREKGDNLVLVYDDDMSHYEIINAEIYDQTIIELRSKLLDCKNKEDEIYYKKKIYEISKAVIKKIKVDAQCRANLGSIYNDTNEVLCIGASDRVILEPINRKESIR